MGTTMNIFTQFFKKTPREQRTASASHSLIREEIKLTADIFGAQPAGGKREFFCLDTHTWIWYEEWIDESGNRQHVTTRYVIRPREILKSQNGGPYHRLTLEEAERFNEAVHNYRDRVKTHLYNPLKQAKTQHGS